MNQQSIQKYGFKAASLLSLKEQGLFPKKLIVLDTIPSFDEFAQLFIKNIRQI